MKMNLISPWTDTLQEEGIYTFSRRDVDPAHALSPEAVKKSLQRLVGKKRIAKVTGSFYVLVPTEYRVAGSPPGTWFIDQLMASRKQAYYVGLLSAAALHGASHHQPLEFQVMTTMSMRPLKVGRQRLHFFTKRRIESTPVSEVKTPTGTIRVSTPEATALDLVRFFKSAGGLGNVATVLQDLMDKLDARRLVEAARNYGDVPAVQRLGYLMDRIHAKSLADPLAAWIRSESPRAMPLRPDRPSENAKKDVRWNVRVNDQIETDA